MQILELPEVYPNGIAFDAQGRLYWTESMAHRVCRLEDGAATVFCQLSDDYVPDGMAFADELLRDRIHFFLQLIGGLDDIVRDFRRAGLSRIFVLFPLLSSGLQSCLYALYGFAVLICAFGYGI